MMALFSAPVGARGSVVMVNSTRSSSGGSTGRDVGAARGQLASVNVLLLRKGATCSL